MVALTHDDLPDHFVILMFKNVAVVEATPAGAVKPHLNLDHFVLVDRHGVLDGVGGFVVWKPHDVGQKHR